MNYYKLSAKSIPGYWPKRSAYKAFREDLVEALFNNGEHLTKPLGPAAIMEDKGIYKAPAEDYGQRPIQFLLKERSCAACVSVGRKGIIKRPIKRKPLIELSVNTT